jgi:hypothetical protein
MPTLWAYTLVNERPPAQADIQRFFRLTPPSVYQMLLTLKREGRRIPSLGRDSVHEHNHFVQFGQFSPNLGPPKCRYLATSRLGFRNPCICRTQTATPDFLSNRIDEIRSKLRTVLRGSQRGR